MQTACLLIHGFGGSIREVAPLAEALSSAGYEVGCAELKGHTGDYKDLGKATYHDWIQSAEEAYLKLKGKHEEITIIGFSMGGLIGLRLAIKYKLKALITINSPIYYWNLPLIIRNIFGDIARGNFANIRRYTSSSGKLPFSAIANFLSLLYKTRPIIPQVNCPVLVLQSLDDDTVQSRSAAYIHRKVSSGDKQIKYYPKGGHVILLSLTADAVIADVKNYLSVREIS
jgi:carboxylesterase